MRLVLKYFLMLLCTANYCLGQDAFRKKTNVEQYYLYQNKAELAIVDSNYTEAIKLYKTAFTFKSPDPRALTNSLHLGLRLNDTAFARACIYNLASNGYPKDHLKNMLSGTGLVESSLFQLISQDYDTLNATFYKSEKAKLGIVLDSILKRDQDIRKRQYSNEDLVQTDKNNTDTLIWFTNKYGFPGYDLVGFADPHSGIALGGIYWLVY
jgi:hypothetical protein